MNDRFWSKVKKTKKCWLWIGAKSHGYGRFYVGKKKNKAAHRVAYEMLVGPIPDGYDLDHLCRVRCCVRPKHVEPVTRGENIKRGKPFNRKRTCKRGHKYTAANVQWEGNRRHCRECIRERRGYNKRYKVKGLTS